MNKQYLIDNFSGDVSAAVSYVQKLKDEIYSELPVRPSKPFLPNGHTSQVASEYADKLKVYESSMEDYKTKKLSCDEKSVVLESALIDFIKDEAGLKHVPEKYQGKLWSKAWEDGHSYGYHEVYLKLLDLVDIFE